MIARILPPVLHRLALRVAHRVRILWWRWRRPVLAGVCVIGRDPQGRVLLVWHSYGKGHWGLPSGSLGRNEDPAHAAQRELREETACSLRDLCGLGRFTHSLYGARNTVHVYTGLIEGTPCPDGREVLEARFFARDALPAPLNAQVPRLLALLDGPDGLSEQG